VLNAYGITSAHAAEVWTFGLDAFVYLDAFRALGERGELSLRVAASLSWDGDDGDEQIAGLVQVREDYTSGRLQITGVKIFQDGVTENQTAALVDPYLNSTAGHGMSMFEPSVLNRIVTALDGEGFQVHFHAVGDRAVRESLDAVEVAIAANGRRDARHHIAHLQLIHPLDIPRFGELGVVANFQPYWASPDESLTELFLPFIQHETARWIYPIGSVQRSGAVVAFGSDWNVTSPNPLLGIETAVTRADPYDEIPGVLLPDERIDLHDALAAYTIHNAYLNHQEDRTGSIEVGKLADLVVLDRNLFEIEASEIADAKVLLTLLGGEPVYGNLDSFETSDE
jgi:hypothetical protein